MATQPISATKGASLARNTRSMWGRATLLIAVALPACTLLAQLPPSQPFPGSPPQQQYRPYVGPRGFPGNTRNPGGAPPFRPSPDRQARFQQPAPPPRHVFQPAQKVAQVGNQPIVAGDLFGPINQALEPYLGQISDEQLAEQRMILMRNLLPAMIETKLVYLDFLRDIPEERLPDIQKQIFDQFAEKQLPRVMEKAGVSTPAELDAKLRGYGSSLSKSRRAFFEQVLAQQMVQQKIDMQPKFTPQELRAYYQEHLDEYSTPAKARWEQLMVRFDRVPDRNTALRMLGELGNEVLGGAPLAAVARAKSHGINADQGGYHDWTVQGSLVSKPLDHYIFTLPINKLSQRFADEKGLHIVRVIQRHDAARVPFKTPANVRVADTRVVPGERNPDQTLIVCRIENSSGADVPVETTVYLFDEPFEFKKSVVPSLGSIEVRFELEKVNPKSLKADAVRVDIEAQARIHAVLRKQKINQQRLEYLARLRELTPVWTIFGDLNDPRTAAGPNNAPR